MAQHHIHYAKHLVDIFIDANATSDVSGNLENLLNSPLIRDRVLPLVDHLQKTAHEHPEAAEKIQALLDNANAYHKNDTVTAAIQNGYTPAA